MHLEYEKYIQRNCGNSYVKSYEKNIACLRKKLYTHKKKIAALVQYIWKMITLKSERIKWKVDEV